jgi:hypothetical protein
MENRLVWALVLAFFLSDLRAEIVDVDPDDHQLSDEQRDEKQGTELQHSTSVGHGSVLQKIFARSKRASGIAMAREICNKLAYA